MMTVGRVGDRRWEMGDGSPEPGDRRWEMGDGLSPIFDLPSSDPTPSSICDLPSSIASVLSSIFHLSSSICRLPRGGRTGGFWGPIIPGLGFMNKKDPGVAQTRRKPFSCLA